MMLIVEMTFASTQEERPPPDADSLAAQPHAPAWLAYLALGSFALLLVITAISLNKAFAPGPPETPGVSSESETETEASPSTQTAEEETLGQRSPEECTTRTAVVTGPGDFSVAAVRSAPGFESNRPGGVARGSYVIVCEVVETPGKHTPDRWHRIVSGAHVDRWIHEDVLKFSP